MESATTVTIEEVTNPMDFIQCCNNLGEDDDFDQVENTEKEENLPKLITPETGAIPKSKLHQNINTGLPNTLKNSKGNTKPNVEKLSDVKLAGATDDSGIVLDVETIPKIACTDLHIESRYEPSERKENTQVLKNTAVPKAINSEVQQTEIGDGETGKQLDENFDSANKEAAHTQKPYLQQISTVSVDGGEQDDVEKVNPQELYFCYYSIIHTFDCLQIHIYSLSKKTYCIVTSNLMQKHLGSKLGKIQSMLNLVNYSIVWINNHLK